LQGLGLTFQPQLQAFLGENVTGFESESFHLGKPRSPSGSLRPSRGRRPTSWRPLRGNCEMLRFWLARKASEPSVAS
jgi:hypothetical protein